MMVGVEYWFNNFEAPNQDSLGVFGRNSLSTFRSDALRISNSQRCDICRNKLVHLRKAVVRKFKRFPLQVAPCWRFRFS